MDAPEQSAVRLAARQTTQRAVETAIFWESTVEGRGPKFRQSPSAKCAGSGKAEKVNGGYHITARKIFVSGAPTGDLLMTGTVLECDGEQKGIDGMSANGTFLPCQPRRNASGIDLSFLLPNSVFRGHVRMTKWARR
jgi:hypothetical protein